MLEHHFVSWVNCKFQKSVNHNIQGIIFYDTTN